MDNFSGAVFSDVPMILPSFLTSCLAGVLKNILTPTD